LKNSGGAPHSCTIEKLGFINCFPKKVGSEGAQVPLAPTVLPSLIFIEKKQNMREKGKISHRDTSDNIGDANKILDRELVSRS